MSKINPIVKDWKLYNKFCNLKNFKYSLFHLQKRAFKVFNKESKNDRFSSKRLINKSFLTPVVSYELTLKQPYCLYAIHISFCCLTNLKSFICIHCGMKHGSS